MLYLPYTTRDAARVVNANELVAGGSDVKVRLLLVDEEGVGYPNVLDEFWADAERLDTRSWLERESWIRPELSEVKIQREVLVRHGRRLIRLEVICVRRCIEKHEDSRKLFRVSYIKNHVSDYYWKLIQCLVIESLLSSSLRLYLTLSTKSWRTPFVSYCYVKFSQSYRVLNIGDTGFNRRVISRARVADEWQRARGCEHVLDVHWLEAVMWLPPARGFFARSMRVIMVRCNYQYVCTEKSQRDETNCIQKLKFLHFQWVFDHLFWIISLQDIIDWLQKFILFKKPSTWKYLKVKIVLCSNDDVLVDCVENHYILAHYENLKVFIYKSFYL